MQDFESVALGLAAGKKKATVKSHVTLSSGQLGQLMRTQRGDPLYDVLCNIMEGVIEVLETEHLQAWSNKELFDRTGIVAVAARKFYERVQKEVNHHIEEYTSQEEQRQDDLVAEAMTPEDIIRRGFGMES